LLVDDSPTYLHTLTAALAADGHTVLQASNGKEALDIVARNQIDCILLDLVMPEMDGKETCRHLKSSPATQDIPVLVLTSVESREAMLEGLALGADDYIQKTSELEVLKARVRAQLRRRQLEEQARSAREQLLRREIEENEARAALELAETRARLVHALEEKNAELSGAYAELKATQVRLVHAAKMVSLGELVAGVAHEINNPLAFALSHLATARNDLAQCQALGSPFPGNIDRHWSRATERLQQMQQGLERIRDLVVKLRTFSRLDEGAERKVVSMRECIDSVLTILQHRIKTSVTLHRADAEPDLVSCYPGPLNQAVMNLVSNALDAIEEAGNIEIETRFEGRNLLIVVSDDGPGIPEDIRDRVMEPFFTTKDVGQGTGLGLSITYSIAQMHKGDFVLENRPGGGARATLRIHTDPDAPGY
jgi:two-component system NtrC family sensor kinase